MSPTAPPTTSPDLERALPASTAPAASPAIVPPAPKPAVRPEGVPESFWDKDKGELKVADWSKSYEELRQAKAEIDARKAAIPAQPDLYKPELPKELNLPAGMEVKTSDPLYLAVRQMAHDKGWTQADFSAALGVYASIVGHEARRRSRTR